MNIKYFRYLPMCTASYCVRYIFEYAAYVHPLILRLRCFRNRDINLKEVYTIVNGSTKKICKLNKTQSMLASIRDSRRHGGGDFLEDLLNSYICYRRSNMPQTPLADTIISRKYNYPSHPTPSLPTKTFMDPRMVSVDWYMHRNIPQIIWIIDLIFFFNC